MARMLVANVYGFSCSFVKIDDTDDGNSNSHNTSRHAVQVGLCIRALHRENYR